MIKSGIYIIKNTENGKVYIGSAVSSVGFNRRWNVHKSQLKGNYHHNQHLQNAWNKYGENSFEFSILEECNDNMLIIREQAWIEYYDSKNRVKGYNVLDADRHTHSEETKKKLSITHSGKNNFFYGKKHTEESLEKMRLASMGNKNCLGQKRSEEAKQKMRMAKLGRKLSEKHKASLKKAWELRKNKEDVNKAI